MGRDLARVQVACKLKESSLSALQQSASFGGCFTSARWITCIGKVKPFVAALNSDKMTKRSRSKKPSRKKKPNHVDPEAAEGRILAAYGLGIGCTLSDSDGSDRDGDSASSSPGEQRRSSTVGESFTAFPPAVPKTQKGVRPDHSFVDLHMHSTCSDGRLSPTALVRKAAANGVRIMALTDHDTMAGVEEAAAAGAQLGVRCVEMCLSNNYHYLTPPLPPSLDRLQPIVLSSILFLPRFTLQTGGAFDALLEFSIPPCPSWHGH